MKLFELLEVTHISPNNIIIEKDNDFCCTLQYASTNVKRFNSFDYYVKGLLQNQSGTVKIKVY